MCSSDLGGGEGDGELEGDSGSFSGSWVVGSWKEGLRRFVVGECEWEADLTGEGDLRWRWDIVVDFRGKGCCFSCAGRPVAGTEMPLVFVIGTETSSSSPTLINFVLNFAFLGFTASPAPSSSPSSKLNNDFPAFFFTPFFFSFFSSAAGILTTLSLLLTPLP